MSEESPEGAKSKPPRRRRIYTRRGDLGETALFGGPRVAKDHPRIDVCGEVDELGTLLATALQTCRLPGNAELFIRIQGELFEMAAELVSPDPVRFGTRTLTRRHVEALEEAIDRLSEELPTLKQFVLPGGSPGAVTLQHARAVCRRVERRVVALLREDDSVSRVLLAYLNRLSDLLFVAARAENAAADIEEIPWVPPRQT